MMFKSKSLSIKLIAPLYISIPVIFLALVLSYIWNTYSRNAVDKISEDNISQIHTLVQTKINEIVAIPARIANINKTLFEEGYLDRNDFETWEEIFKEEFREFKWLSSIVWGDANGRSLWIGRYADGNVYWATKEDPKSDSILEWQLNEEGNRIADSENSFKYNLFSRPWFIGPKESGNPQWTKPFIWAGGESSSITVGISYGIPIYDDKNTFIGIMDADFSLNDLSSYLQTIKIGKSGIALIVTNHGKIIASSNSLNNIKPDGTIATLAETNNLLASVADTFLSERVLSNQSDDLITGKLQIDNDSISISSSRVGKSVGLQWNIVTLVPDSDFLAEIDKSYFNSTIISVIAVLLTILLGLFASHWLIKPLLKITKFTKTINTGDLHKTIELKHTLEYEELTDSINLMIAKLNSSREHEVLLNRELDHRVKNMLSQIVSICRQATNKCTTDIATLEDLTMRVAGIASIHELLATNNNIPITLKALIDVCCKPYAADAPNRIDIDGPEIALNSKAALCLGMVFNELANNSLKYGSLADSKGKIKINWDIKESKKQKNLEFNWVEQHTAELPESIDGGIGSKIIRHAIPHELEGAADISIIENGICFSTSIPIQTIQ